MSKDDREIVSALRLALADRVGPERFELWFGSNTRLALTDGCLVVNVSSPFYQEWLRNNFRRELEASCVAALGKQLDISFQVDTTLAETRTASSTTKSVEQSSLASDSKTVNRAEGAVSAKPAGRRFASLDTFVAGASNRLAWTSAGSVSDRLGTSSPLVIHGPTGVGKTHLLEGIWSAVKKKNPAAHSLYLTAEQFTSHFLAALHGGGLPSFRRKYRGIDLLVIDDVQFFANKKATCVELLHTIDTSLREGRQLVFAADRAPTELTDVTPELIVRLQGGLVCPIGSPDYDIRLGIARRMADELEIFIPDDVLKFVASNINTHARALSGALRKLDAASRAHQCPITLALAEETLGDVIRSARDIRLPDIEQAICNVFGLAPKTLQSEGVARRVNHPRMLAMWLARKHTRAALVEIGEYFGRRSHSTVISAQKKISALMSEKSPLDLADKRWNVEEAIRKVEENLRVG